MADEPPLFLCAGLEDTCVRWDHLRFSHRQGPFLVYTCGDDACAYQKGPDYSVCGYRHAPRQVIVHQDWLSTLDRWNQDPREAVLIKAPSRTTMMTMTSLDVRPISLKDAFLEEEEAA